MDRLELPKSEYPIHRQIEIKIYLPFLLPSKKGEIRYATERISQTPQGSVRHQDERQRMAGGLLARHLSMRNIIL